MIAPLLRTFRIKGTAHEANLFAGECNEDDRLPEAALAQHAGQLEDDGRPARIVAGARRIGVSRLFIIHLVVDRDRRAVRSCFLRARLFDGILRIVVAADDKALFGIPGSRQHRHNIYQFDVANDARALLLHLVSVVSDFEPRAEAGQLIVNPLARRADAACFRG